MVFKNRRDAGRQLAAQLMPLAAVTPVVLALPRGGVPVAAEIALALDAPLDVLSVRKLGAPHNPEFGVGAVAEDGTAVLDAEAARRVGMTQAQLERTLEIETRELKRRMERFRDGWAPLDVQGRTVVVVDDGLATGLTDLAAVRALRARGAGRIVVAVPVASREAVALLGEEADEVVCHTIPHDFGGVGRWYQDFAPVSDEEVLSMLAAAGARVPPPRHPSNGRSAEMREVVFLVGSAQLRGDLTVPTDARGLVIFAHGSGSSRLSTRNRGVALSLNGAGFATLLFDLLSEEESERRANVFDIPLLAGRLEAVTRWALEEPSTRDLPIGYFGASTGAAASLRAAAEAADAVRAVVSRGGRPDLAADRLALVEAPTLLIVGSLDADVLDLNRHAAAQMHCPNRIAVVDGAGHLFEEPGALDTVARLAIEWFDLHLLKATAAAEPVAGTG